MAIIEVLKPEEGEKCKLRRIRHQIRTNAKLSNVDIEVNEVCYKNDIKIIEYDFYYWGKKYIRLPFCWKCRFWAQLDTEKCELYIGGIDSDMLFDRIYEASKKLFENIEGLTVILDRGCRVVK